jgi:osmotically inducible protein OsmC
MGVSRGTDTTMAKVLYTAEATVTGGRADGHGRTSDGVLDVQLRLPKEMGGEETGTNPEQLFAVGYAACFEGALGVIGRREHLEVGDVSIDSRVSLLPTEERGFSLAVQLDVTLPQVQDAEQATRIVAAAHQVCPYSNATRGNIDVTLTANGHAIA